MKKILLFILTLVAIMPVSEAKRHKTESLKVISYNIRLMTADDGPNSWEYRKIATPAMIKDNMPDVFGVQEAYPEQLQYILDNCPQYKCVGVGREDGKSKGEHMSIFYNTDKVELLDWGTYWLSETPDVPTKGWDADCYRTATWTKMKMKGSKIEFFYVNTHLDHIGKDARRNGLALIVERIGKMNPKHIPMVLTGDFNMRPDDPSLADLNKIMTSAREAAEDSDAAPSANAYKKGGSIIDYIYYSGFKKCTDFKVINKTYENVPFISDHYPVRATLIF